MVDIPMIQMETTYTSSRINEPNQPSISECSRMINSEQWLKGPRYGNIHHELHTVDDHLIQQMILNMSNFANTIRKQQLSTLFGQTLCYPQSQFRNVTLTNSYDNYDDDDFLDESPIVRQWAVKFVYLSIHFHQHQYAIPEAEQRYGKNNDDYDTCVSQTELTSNYGVGRFDYECPGAKYLVMALGGNGLGANVRGGMVPAMMLGLMTDRVVLFMNNIPATDNTTSDYIQKEWTLSSCPRKDYQCFFWPVSPCVLTEDDINDAYRLNVSESRRLIKRDEIPIYADHYKVWIWTTSFQPIVGFHQPSAEKLYEYAQQLVSPTLYENINSGKYYKLLNRSVELIRTNDGYRDLYHYAAASYKIQHTMTIYLLRPHPQIAQKLENMLSDIIPNDFNPEYAIGLPVRGKSTSFSFF
jgi:hypothetical protein